jgi:hypothetical protein
MANHVQFEDMIVDLIGIGIEAAEGVDYIITTICHGCVHQAGRSLTKGPCNLRSVAIYILPAFNWGIGH